MGEEQNEKRLEDILSASLRLFLEKGSAGTSAAGMLADDAAPLPDGEHVPGILKKRT